MKGAVLRVSLVVTFACMALQGCLRPVGPHLNSGSESFVWSEARPYVKVLYSAPLTFDPAKMDDTASLSVSQFLYDGLLAFTDDLELQGALAKAWSISADGKTLSFELRENVRFHDGSVVSSNDVVRSIEHLVAPGSKVYSYYDCIAGADQFHSGKAKRLTGVIAAGPLTVKILLKAPFPPFLSVLAGATAKVLPAARFTEPSARDPIGAGPFRYLGTKQNADGSVDITFERFDRYYGTVPKIKRLVIRAADEKLALQQASQGAVHDLANYPLTGEESVFKVGQHLQSPVAATWIIGLNTRTEPFRDVSVRRAFRDALDVEAFRKRFHPDAVPAQGYIPPGMAGFEWHYPDRPRSTPAQPKKSRRLIKIAIPRELSRHAEMKSFLENAFQSKGWNVEVEPMPWSKLMKGFSEKSHQAFLASMNMDYPDSEFLIRSFESGNPDNFSGLKNHEIDRLIAWARTTGDRMRRQALYVTLVGLLHDAAVTIDLFHPRGHYWVHSCVRGFKPNLLADYYIDYRSVELDQNCKGVQGGIKE